MSNPTSESNCCTSCKRKFRTPDTPSDEEAKLEERRRSVVKAMSELQARFSEIDTQLTALRDARYAGTNWHKCCYCNAWTDNEGRRSRHNGLSFYYCNAHGSDDE